MKRPPCLASLVPLVLVGMTLLAGCSDDRSSAPQSSGLLAPENVIDLPSSPGQKGFCGSDEIQSGLTWEEATLLSNVEQLTTYYGTDFVSAGVGGLRDVGTGTIQLAGVSGPVSLAFLYWNGPTNSSDPSVNAVVDVNGTTVTGVNIGFSHDNCWGFDNSQSYRADVTALVQGTGNGAYLLENLAIDDNTVVGGANTNGASLVVFFDDGNPANNRDVVLFDGNDANISNPFDADGWNVALEGIVYIAGQAGLQLHVADGQVYDDSNLFLNGNLFVAGPHIFQGTSVPSANNGPMDLGSLWDIRTFNLTPFLSPGSNDLEMTMGDQGPDCLGLVVAIIDLPAGSAPGQPAFFTGGGHLGVGNDQDFGFNVGPREYGAAAKGNLQFNDHLTGLRVKSSSIAIYNAGGDCAAFSGTCKVDNMPGGIYQALVCDLDEPGAGVDIFILRVWDSGGALVVNVADTIQGGNIQRHALMPMVLSNDLAE